MNQSTVSGISAVRFRRVPVVSVQKPRPSVVASPVRVGSMSSPTTPNNHIQKPLSLEEATSILSSECQPDSPKTLILAMGGTIAGSSQKDKTDGGNVGYKSGVLKVDDLISAVPDFKGRTDIAGVQVSSVSGQDMSDTHLQRLFTFIEAAEQHKGVKNIVILQGTDSAAETAYGIDVLFPYGKNKVVSGAMRTGDMISPDGPASIRDAVLLANHPDSENRGVLFTHGDKIHTARYVYKADPQGIEAFKSANGGTLGVMGGKKDRMPHFFYNDKRPSLLSDTALKALSEKRKDIIGKSNLSKSEIIFSHQGADPKQVDTLVNDGYKSLILAGSGEGNSSAEMIERLSQAVKQGLAVTRSFHGAEGVVFRNGEIDDDKHGFTVSGDLSPLKARILSRMLLETMPKEALSSDESRQEYLPLMQKAILSSTPLISILQTMSKSDEKLNKS